MFQKFDRIISYWCSALMLRMYFDNVATYPCSCVKQILSDDVIMRMLQAFHSTFKIIQHKIDTSYFHMVEEGHFPFIRPVDSKCKYIICW